jgi:hypothetical protein
VFPVAVIAAIAVVAVAVSAYLMAPQSASVGDALGIIPGSPAFSQLEQEREQLIAMTAAVGTLTTVTKPKLASPGQAVIVNNQSTTLSGGNAPVIAAPADPTGAEAIAEGLLGSFGFSQDQYSCLYDLWNRESSWNVYAENPTSGAYGIPQALPGDRMAVYGADWQTNPATQIKWGLSYIKSTYGSPCNAWDFEEANGYY